jgi:HD-GYP domain-containing protein (c-di-GMP phosphodiesterase class II)
VATVATRVSRAEVVGALSLATDAAMGQPLESGLGICRLALALADAAGLDDSERDRIYYMALLRHVGCTAESHSFAEIVGDELDFRAGAMNIDATNPRAMGPYMLRHLVRANGLMGAAGKMLQMAGQRDRFQEGVVAVCEVAELLAGQLGLDEQVQRDLLLGVERWDGKGFLKRAGGEEVPVAVRVVQIAECASVYNGLGGADAATDVVRDRAGTAFDPRLAELFATHASELLASVQDDDSHWDAVMAAAPADDVPLSGDRLGDALRTVSTFADLKSPFTVDHSTGVAELAHAAALQAGRPSADAEALRCAALVHDLGRVAVSSTIWEKQGSLSADEWERVRLHPYHTERFLSRSPGLASLASTASLHHERCDGSGYHRSADARSLPFPARLLAAADSYHAMREPRPHRAALSADAAAAQLRDEARAGRLDADAVDCVLAAAGERPRRRRAEVAGLTAREVEVLRLLARGLATKQIAAQLVISPKTADSHIQHIYSKLGVSTRAAATVFAMRHDLIESSGELPM